ncbi:MAG: hypothetical protein V1777_04625 [Candidatus Micrarchaeota archaeon]
MVQKFLVILVFSALFVVLSGCTTPAPVCGNGQCENPENAENCAADCQQQGFHFECSNQKCQRVSGQGNNSCESDNDCAIAATHLECQNNACRIVEGEGEDQCQRDSDCNASGCIDCRAVQPETCADSDNGKNYYEKGTVAIGTKTYSDSCQDANKVLEYYCSTATQQRSERHVCPNGCSDGKCQIASCTAGEKKCEQDQVLKCGTNNEWALEAECSNGCQNAACVADWWCMKRKMYNRFMSPGGIFELIPVEITETTPGSGEYQIKLRYKNSDNGITDIKTVGEKTYLSDVFGTDDAGKKIDFDRNYFVDEIGFEAETGKKYWFLANDSCNPCEPGQLACIGAQQQQCNAEGNGWSLKENCFNNCDNEACLPPCTPGEQKCEVGVLQKCTEKGIWQLNGFCP